MKVLDAILDICGIFDPQRYTNNLYLINLIHIFMVKISFCCSCIFDCQINSFADFYLFFLFMIRTVLIFSFHISFILQ